MPDFTTKPLFFALFFACFFLGSLGVFILRKLRLKSGRDIAVEGRVADIKYASLKLRSLTQKGDIVEVEYKVNGVRYTMNIGNHTKGIKRIFHVGERVELVCNAENPRIVYWKSSPVLYLFMVISSVAFVFSIIILFV
ncbi:MAG: hypothetical protein IJI50_04010 [Ruminococcus sp.]|nr:hypothetical protein [Ruminococcus sp.]